MSSIMLLILMAHAVLKTEVSKTLLGQNGPRTASLFLFKQKRRHMGVKMGEEQANKALGWFFFSAVNKEKTGDCGTDRIGNPAKKPER